MAAKKCTKCGEEKPLDQFYEQAECKDGFRPDCIACFKAACAARAPRYAAKKRAYNAAYRAKHPNKDREYYEKNKAEILRKQVEYNRRNRDAYNAKLRRWRKENPEKVQVWVRNRRAKLKGLSGRHALADILALLESQQGMCVYCRCDIRQSYQVDHRVPVSRGGSNDKSNLQLLCKPCNLDKRAQDPDEYLKTRSLRKEDDEDGGRIKQSSGMV